MKIAYSFCVLRYVHDPLTAEFVNVGVVLYAPDVGYANAVCTSHYARLSEMFQHVDGEHFREMTRYLQRAVSRFGEQLRSGLLFAESVKDIDKLTERVLPRDDSAFQFSPAGGGFTSDPDETLHDLYNRYVERYASRTKRPSREDEDVWRVFKRPLEEHHVIEALTPKRIVAPNYEYKFRAARKNRIWHTYEPVSFDLLETDSILDKANRWVGRATSLVDSKEEFKMHMLLGKPQERKLRDAFAKAQNILHKMPCRCEFVHEDDAEEFAKSLKDEIAKE